MEQLPELLNKFACWWSANWLTVVSIILSGLISLVISAWYFNKGNRSNLQMSFVFPVVRILKEPYSVSNYKELCNLSESYSVRFMKKKEREIWLTVLPAYKEIMNHTEVNEKVEILQSYFEYKLKKNGIDVKPVPIEYEGETVYYDYPPDINYMYSDLEEALKKCEYSDDQDEMESIIKTILQGYLKQCYGCKDVAFFQDFSLTKVLATSRVRSKWEEKYKVLESAINKFYSLKIVMKTTK